MQNWIEVAPAPLISHQKSSNSPKLEPILEEGSENSEVLQKGVFFVIPLLLSVGFYLFLHRDDQAWHDAFILIAWEDVWRSFGCILKYGNEEQNQRPRSFLFVVVIFVALVVDHDVCYFYRSYYRVYDFIV